MARPTPYPGMAYPAMSPPCQSQHQRPRPTATARLAPERQPRLDSPAWKTDRASWWRINRQRPPAEPGAFHLARGSVPPPRCIPPEKTAPDVRGKGGSRERQPNPEAWKNPCRPLCRRRGGRDRSEGPRRWRERCRVSSGERPRAGDPRNAATHRPASRPASPCPSARSVREDWGEPEPACEVGEPRAARPDA